MKLGMLLLSVLIGGCVFKAPLPDCPVPPSPALPELLAGEPLESAANMRVLMERDDCMRLYIQGLEGAVECLKKIGER